VTTDGWAPEQYRRFASERSQPFHDLLGLVERVPVRRAVDLGCGSGELTRVLVERLEPQSTVGIDNSPAMLADAAAHAGTALRFELGDIGTWTAHGDHDLVFANASLQWVPDHATVLARWAGALTPDGQLAVQVPANGDHPSHVLAAELSREEPYRSAFGGHPPPDAAATNVLHPEDYAVLLHDLGFAHQHVRLQVYAHVLGSSAEVVEWVRGTTLTRFAALGPELLAQFVDEYRSRLLAEIGHRSPYLYPFKRILFWARGRPAS
jgi:trans-aconitate 2-methyltransferase